MFSIFISRFLIGQSRVRMTAYGFIHPIDNALVNLANLATFLSLDIVRS